MGIRQRDADLAKGGRLYNLENEIGEQTDLATQNPDIVARLTQLAETMTADLAANKRPAGLWKIQLLYILPPKRPALQTP